MNVIIIGPVYPFRGGIAHFTTLLSKAFKEKNHSVQVVSFKRQYPMLLYPGKSDKDPSEDVISFPAVYILDPMYPWTWFRAADVIFSLKPDIVILQWWTTFWAPAYGVLVRLLNMRGIKVCTLIHNVYPHETRFFDPMLVKFALRDIKMHVTLSENQRQILSLLLPKAEITCIAHPIYTMYSNKLIDKHAAREKLGVPMDRKVALFFGIVRPYKGLRLLLDALSLLVQQGHPVHLLVGGEFWEEVDDYRKLIEREGIEDCVTIHNRYIPNEEVSYFFSAADFFVAPYISGTQSGALKIALGFGLPIIASQVISDNSDEISKELIHTFSTNNTLELANTILSIESIDLKPNSIIQTKDDWHNIVDLFVKYSVREIQARKF